MSLESVIGVSVGGCHWDKSRGCYVINMTEYGTYSESGEEIVPPGRMIMILVNRRGEIIGNLVQQNPWFTEKNHEEEEEDFDEEWEEEEDDDEFFEDE